MHEWKKLLILSYQHLKSLQVVLILQKRWYLLILQKGGTKKVVLVDRWYLFYKKVTYFIISTFKKLTGGTELEKCLD